MRLKGARSRIRFAANSAKVRSAIIVGCDWVSGGAYAQSMLTGQLQPGMAVRWRMRMRMGTGADQAIGRGLIHPCLLLHGIILWGGT